MRPYHIPQNVVKPERTPDLVLLIVETDTGDASDELEVRQVVRETLGVDARGRYWFVERLLPATGSQASALDRYFRVSGSIDVPPPHFDKAAFELAYRLRDAGNFRVEPDLTSSFFASSEMGVLDTKPKLDQHPSEQEEHLAETRVNYSWALDAIHCREAWGLRPPEGGAARGEGIVIAHPDTGYTNHPDTGIDSFDLRRDKDLLSDDDDALDPLERWWELPVVHPGHGTSTAGVLAGRRVTKIEGVAPLATVVPLRTIKSVAQVLDTDVAHAVHYACHNANAHVISMSLGGLGFLGLRQAIEYAVSNGLIVLAAAGQEVPWVVAPARYPNCIAVAATNVDDNPWAKTCRGPEIDISAPGEGVWVAKYDFGPSGPQPDIYPHDGTSFAVTHAAGTAALWLAYHGRKMLIERYGESRLQAAFLHLVATHGHRRPEGWDTHNFGPGIIDAKALLTAPLPDTSEVDVAYDSLAEAASTPPVPGDRVAALFPELSHDKVTRRFATLFAVTGHALTDKLNRYEAEFARLFSERRDAWEAFMNTPTDGGVHPDTTPASPPSVLSDIVAQLGSPTLAREMEVRR